MRIITAALGMFASSHCHTDSITVWFFLSLSVFLQVAGVWAHSSFMVSAQNYIHEENELSGTWKEELSRPWVRSALTHYSKLNVGLLALCSFNVAK